MEKWMMREKQKKKGKNSKVCRKKKKGGGGDGKNETGEKVKRNNKKRSFISVSEFLCLIELRDRMSCVGVCVWGGGGGEGRQRETFKKDREMERTGLKRDRMRKREKDTE